MTPNVLMLIVTIGALVFMLVFCLILKHSMIYIFVALFLQSVFLFLIRWLWIGKTPTAAFFNSFDLVTIVVIIGLTIHTIQKKAHE
ncbi:hypothetical protein [Staphylococcus edaphicus]|uniref:Uncharacterized protein n=1 Tax=Staphylococcus edaphicus TaxID=1955013 RepID=A0A2C6WJK8_9STAP|nr:hypothetical protein [Staphylococcus edaphicus]PHK48569.1 hypothetical protein BTJ66_12940 [Staphylococcus edaphicus]UQW81448.1 hypothetical protein MNY58_12965 [Staphylococcus edaphicus]